MKGPSAEEVLKKARSAEAKKDLAGALNELNEFLDRGPSGDDATKVQAEKDRITADVTKVVEKLVEECGKLLQQGDTRSLGEAVSKGDTLLTLAPLVDKNLGELKGSLETAKKEWEEIKTGQDAAETAFKAGKVTADLKVPRGKYLLNQALVIEEGGHLSVATGAHLKFSEDVDLVMRKGGKLTLEPSAKLEFIDSSELAVNKGAALEIGEGVEVIFGSECGLTAMGKVTATGSPEKPVRFHPPENEVFLDLFFDGEGASDSKLKHVEIVRGQGRPIPGIKGAKPGETHGGAVAVIKGAKVALEAVKVSYGNAAGGGGLFVWKSEVTCKDCVFEGNKAGHWGGGVFAYAEAVVHITGGEFRENQSFEFGGAVMAQDKAKVILEGVRFVKNVAQRSGGACAFFERSETTATKIHFEENQAGMGGAVDVDKANGIFVECTFKKNAVGGVGGAVAIADTGRFTIKFDRCLFEENFSGRDSGGAVWVGMRSRVEFTGGEFKSNRAPNGGGVFLEGPALTAFNGVTFSKNEATEGRGRGGAILAEPISYLARLGVGPSWAGRTATSRS
jgi:predicted outer membrane repeat protein